jgi:hypothetical protein
MHGTALVRHSQGNAQPAKLPKGEALAHYLETAAVAVRQASCECLTSHADAVVAATTAPATTATPLPSLRLARPITNR